MATSSNLPPTALLSVGIVGSGRTAQALGALLASRGVPIQAVAGRTPDNVETAQRFMGAKHAVTVNEAARHANLLLISVSDNAIAEVASAIAAVTPLPRVVLHTSGATGPAVLHPLQEKGVATGVLHPLQTVPSPERGLETLTGATYGYCGDPKAAEQALLLIGILGGKPLPVLPDRWAHYHAASVMAINYHSALFHAALELMQQAGIERESALAALDPIVRAATDNLLAKGPEFALTGPIRRGDTVTVARHLQAVQSASPNTRRLYLAAAQTTLDLAKRAGLSEEAALPVAALLDESSSV